MITPSNEQNKGIKAIINWYENEPCQQEFLLDGQAGTGKAQPLTCKIMTPDGPKAMGEIEIGDVVCGPLGNTNVIAIPFNGMQAVYKITFRDGFHTFCSKQHLWTVKDLHGRWRTLTTEFMMKMGEKDNSGNCRWQIPLTSPVLFNEKAQLEIDPYVLGVLIGDGYLGGSIVAFCNPENEIKERVASLLPDGFSIKTDTAPSCPRHTIKSAVPGHNWIKRYLSQLGLCVKSKEKFIPNDYLFASPIDRLELLRGLMDTDGTSRGNRISYSTSSSQLAADVCFLVQSLGGTAIVKNYRDDECTINVKMTICPFSLSRKAVNWSASIKNPPSRYVTDIEYIGECEQRCLTVDSQDGLYLTDNFICTHNSSTVQVALAELHNRHRTLKIAQAAYTAKAALVMKQKGAPQASTIHRLIYRARHDDKGHLFWELWNNGPANDAGLIVLDECSMIPTKIANDLRSFGKKILILGDVDGQLPPIHGEGAFTSREPDFRLLELNRFAMEDPINALAQRARRGVGKLYPAFSEGNVILKYFTTDSYLDSILNPNTQIICGRHKVRWAITRSIRTRMGYEDPMPCVDEPIICCQNNYKMGLFNGEFFRATSIEEYAGLLQMTWDDEDGNPAPETDVSRHLFDAHYTERKLPDPEYDPNVAWMDFGYAITCHKAQGSEWPHVTIIDDSASFGWSGQELKRRWLYTAITRASEGLTLLLRK